MIKLYVGDDIIKYVVGTDEDTDTIVCTEEPTEVRVFANENGTLLTKVASLPAANEWIWNDVDGQVELGESKTDIIVCLKGDKFIFDGHVIDKDGDLTARTFKETLKVKNSSDTYKGTNVTITQDEFILSNNTSESWITVSKDDSTYSTSITYDEILPESEETFYAKVIIPTGLSVYNYRNLGLQVEYAQELYE